ncbi:hypothetical protein U879_17570 [Defluviimonas sp. 20V17]|uniref:Uncharacterized protein n=1 Tax=Allgaiera indica TaxID=765699 RepID=A0AAN4URV8_9RHOB|nr:MULTISPECIES: hypothetical protein [Paracoccaceae]KDB02396.1 hypothetical protein U879_17570 [Defluviimonas sp. 20V17]GHE02184.1 hypothetical protein GCM10008024_20780 [Allgaiera indica]SDX06280.1 hypothetical protein SAMN05444006_109132 [Allgaiera indica]
MNFERIKAAIPAPPPGPGRKSVIRLRPDVAEVVVDCVLRRRQFADIAKRCAVDIETLATFRKNYITPEVEKVVRAEATLTERRAVDSVINEAQDDVSKGILGIINEQKALYRALKAKVEEEGRDLEDLLPGLAQLLRDQTKTHEAMLKTYSLLKDKTTVMVSLNEHPDAAPLLDALFLLFTENPAAGLRFREIMQAKRITLDVA